MAPLVSLLVPVYNRAELLGACLDSARDQTMTDFEVVVVDGASTDGTWEVCEQYAAVDPRIRVIRQASNLGPVMGWRRCLDEARGTYATFLWSDDLLAPTFLERTLPALGDPEVGFVHTSAEIGRKPGTGIVRYRRPTSSVPSETYVDTVLRNIDVYPVSPACALFRLADLRASFTQSLPTDPPTDLSWTGAGTDVLFYLQTAARYGRIVSINEPLAFFRAHAGSISVEGRAGLVQLHYALAVAWFARQRGRTRASADILARHWLTGLRRQPTWTLPWAATRRYAGLVTTPQLMEAAVRIALRLDRRLSGS